MEKKSFRRMAFSGVGAEGGGRKMGDLDGMGSERTLLFRTLVSRCPIHRVSSDMVVAGPQPIFAR